MQQSGENKLLRKYHAGECIPEEQAMVAHHSIYAGIMPQNLLAMQPGPDGLRQRAARPHINLRKVIRFARVAAASPAFAILPGVGTLIFSTDKNLPAAYANNADHGSDKAVLVLLARVNGTRSNLSDARISSLLHQSGIEIIKSGYSTLVYKVASKSNTSGYNTITTTTPKAGQYNIVLPDGIGYGAMPPPV